jgi:hypothetical protein
MNKTAKALSSKLTMQLNELQLKIERIAQQLQALPAECKNTLRNINSASVLPNYILPEQEIARLRYILTEQKILERLEGQINLLETEKALFESEQLRIKTEIKRLESYQEKQHHLMQLQAVTKTEKMIDSWVNSQSPNAGFPWSSCEKSIV